ncbi:FHA domain-containing protein [Pseudomonas asuensis]|uniref:EscD/YscD/HrpQ family type III secretion system inner membrane ring protein n=1 Tax=Pseudomonas asuensis TaxID=1825787 RepID=A0ABQ2H4N3_9PSED|nr:FHA domain-containing protein [Pseudomonas asuensis]GGM31150.1 EscD/YscD/HrpQ family type III secretion system inner membrane ring protein [Pseudomonas asuensis]
MFELRVLTGLHQGAALPLVGEQWLIGSNDDLDLALHDIGVEPQHCRLQREDDRWILTSEEGAVLDDEGHTHPLTAVHPNSPFVLGSVWLSISPAGEAWPMVPASVQDATSHAATDQSSEGSQDRTPTRKGVSLFSRSGTVIIGILLGVVGSAWSLSQTGTSSRVPAERFEKNEQVQAKPELTKPGIQRIRLSAEETRLRLKTMLSDRLLSDITVEQMAHGLVLRGNLQDEMRPVYQRMLQRFDEQYESSAALVDQVSVGGTTLPFVIVQIMSGPQAHLVTAQGKRLYVGDELDGLRLTRIDDGRVVFDGERHYEVVW